MIKRIAIMGVDGTGKTTLLRNLQERLGGESAGNEFLRIPQTALNPRTSFRAESRAFEALSLFADHYRDLSLKTAALFLPMSLSGWIQRDLLARSNTRLLVYERQPVIDSLVYADFYTPHIRTPLSNAQMLSVQATLPQWQDVLAGFKAFQRNLQGTLPHFPGTLTQWNREFLFSELPLFIRDLFALPFLEKIGFLSQLYGYEGLGNSILPTHAILLRLTPEQLELRLKERKKSANLEVHEEVGLLLKLQDQLIQRARDFCQSRSGSLRLEILDVTHTQPLEFVRSFI